MDEQPHHLPSLENTAMTSVVLLLRLALAVLFTAAAVAMFRRRHNVRRALQHHGFTSAWARATSTVMPLVESGLAIALLVSDLVVLGAVSGAFLVFLFTAAVSVVLKDSRSRSCHSFRAAAGGPGGWTAMTRGMVLGVLEDSERRALRDRRPGRSAEGRP
jgi:hypothetical protein